MPTYEAGEFEPPAPVVRAVVRGPKAIVENVPFLIDTGADVTVVPLNIALQAGALVTPSDVLIQFLDGEETTCLQSNLAIEFLRYRFNGQFLVTECEHGVIGRNILNLLLVTLDGPSLNWSA